MGLSAHELVVALLRFAVQGLAFFLLLAIVLAVGSHYTGAVEKAALIAVGVLLLVAVVLVRRVGHRRATRGS